VQRVACDLPPDQIATFAAVLKGIEDARLRGKKPEELQVCCLFAVQILLQHLLLAHSVPLCMRALQGARLAAQAAHAANHAMNFAAMAQALIKELVATHLTVQGDRDASSWRDQVITPACLLSSWFHSAPHCSEPTSAQPVLHCCGT